MGETTFHSARIDKVARPPDRGWFLTEDLEQDPYPASNAEPRIRWKAHNLEIAIPSNELAGSIERRVGDLTIMRSYVHSNAE